MGLENVKVGDWIKLQVTDINSHPFCPIRCGDNLSFTKNGIYLSEKEQIAFPLEPTERWMMVSDDRVDWYRRKVIAQKNDMFIAWSSADTDEAISRTSIITGWKYAKEVEECPVEITLEDIAEKFGVDVNLIKIKK